MNYYPFHLGDYAAHTAHLEPMEDLAYRRMLDLYYLREQALPLDPAEVARLIRMRGNVAEVEAVLREFFSEGPDGWLHARCDAELSRMQDKQAKAKASAQASVSARQARQTSERTANVERTLNERSTEAELPTPTPTPTPIHSVPDGTGSATAPPTDRDAVFAVGITLLTAAGVEDRNARSFLAQQSKAHGDAVVLEALNRCATERPIQPIPWLISALKSRPAKASKHSGFESKNYREGVTEDGHIA